MLKKLSKILACALRSLFLSFVYSWAQLLTKYQVGHGLAESKPTVEVVPQLNSTYYLLDWVNKNYVAISLALV